MREQAAKQLLIDLMEWQLRLEATEPGLNTSEQTQYVKEQQSLLDELMDHLESQYALSDYADEQWPFLRENWEQELVEKYRQEKIQFQAKAADHSGFRYLSVVEIGEPIVVSGEVQLSLSAFPHDEPEELEAFKKRYIHEPYNCYQIDLTVPEVRAHLGLDAQ